MKMEMERIVIQDINLQRVFHNIYKLPPNRVTKFIFSFTGYTLLIVELLPEFTKKI